jgi:hypothetical protein
MSGLLLAHASASGGGGGGGANLLLILLGLGAVAAALALRSGRPRVPDPAIWVLAGVGALVTVLGLVSPAEKQPEVTLTVLSPDPGASVRPDQPFPVSVEVKGGRVARSPKDSGGHLHLSVDGALEQMPYGTTTKIRVPRGRHLLRVEYVDEDHKSYDPPIAVDLRLNAF